MKQQKVKLRKYFWNSNWTSGILGFTGLVLGSVASLVVFIYLLFHSFETAFTLKNSIYLGILAIALFFEIRFLIQLDKLGAFEYWQDFEEDDFELIPVKDK